MKEIEVLQMVSSHAKRQLVVFAGGEEWVGDCLGLLQVQITTKCQGDSKVLPLLCSARARLSLPR